MPHQCVRCGKFYPDGSEELLKGCSCGGKFFFYVKKTDIEQAKQLTVDLTPEEKQQIEADVKEIIGEEIEDDQPVVLELENIRILKPGKYEIDLVDLFKGKPLVYKLGQGKYVIDLLTTFKKIGTKKEPEEN
ncbi:MAG: Zn-ribbon containing protein [Candidatus Omnitrophota bacterium]|nr:Zn-ribbon containing protein [Candidatus Omnitrophota bacterium]